MKRALTIGGLLLTFLAPTSWADELTEAIERDYVERPGE